MPDTYGWATLDEAEAYFALRLGASDHWNSNTNKPAALTTAYNMLRDSGNFSFPASEEATEAQLETMKRMQFEQALFIASDIDGIMSRMNLQAQGVIEAGIVSEKYNSGVLIPIAGTALALGKELLAAKRAFGAVKISRDERTNDV